MEKSPPLVSTPLLSEAYCRTPVLLFRLPVLSTPCTPWHELELSPPPVTVNVWLESPLLFSCSVPWLTCAMAGTAATTTIASKAANNIIFFIPFSFFSLYSLTHIHKKVLLRNL